MIRSTDIDKTLAQRERAEQSRRDAARRWAEKYAARRRAQVQVSRDGAKTVLRRVPAAKKPSGDFSPATRRVIAMRSGGRCEVGLLVCRGEATEVHHRKLRRHGDHRRQNGLHVCHACHRAIHASVGLAFQSGWLVRSEQDPAQVPALLRDARRVYLTSDGHYSYNAESSTPAVGVGGLPEDNKEDVA